MIRPISLKELPRLLEIQVACVRGLTQTYTSEEMEAWIGYIEREGPERYAKYQNRGFFDEADCLVGFVSWSQSDQENSVAIDCLYVLNEHRQHGIGWQLLQDVEANLAHGTTMHVRATLNAQPFYERHGYIFIEGSISRAGFAIALLEKRL